jgi:hypothetical protein
MIGAAPRYGTNWNRVPVFFLEIGAHDVSAAAGAADADSSLAGTFLQPGDELLQVLRCKVRSSNQPHRTIRNE